MAVNLKGRSFLTLADFTPGRAAAICWTSATI